MKPKLILPLFLIFTFLLSSCAPNQAMVATLTMLPGTPTPKPPTPWPTRPPRATNTLAPVNTRLATDTPTPAVCAPGSVDSAAPDDPSQLPGRRYDLKNLPKEFTMQAAGKVGDTGYQWVQVKWQGRSLFWTQKQVCVDTYGVPGWEIVDVLALPRLDAKMGEAMTTRCFQGDQPVALAVAYGIYDPNQPASDQKGNLRGWPLQIQAAWEIQPNFTPLSLNGLSCVVVEKK